MSNHHFVYIIHYSIDFSTSFVQLNRAKNV